MEKQPQRHTTRRIPGLVTLLLLAAGSLGAQSADLVLQSDRFQVGDRITLDIRVSEPDSSKVSLAPVSLPTALALQSGPFIRPGVWKQGDQQIAGTLVSYTFSVRADGVVELGPFTVRTVGAGEIRTGTRTLYLLKPDEAGRRYPLEYEWTLGKGPYYEYQAIPVTYMVKNLGYLPALKEIPLAVPGNVLLERAPGITEMKVVQMGDESLFQVPYDSWILIPLRSGPVQVQPTSYQVDNLSRTTLPLRLDVLPLPAELKTTRAVGSFVYSAEVRSRNVSMGEEVVVRLELKGSGNFPTLNLPVPEIPGFTRLSQDELNEFAPSFLGYTGSKTVVSRFSPQRPGPQTITLPGFTWMMPEGGRIFTQAAKDLSINIHPGLQSTRSQDDSLELLEWSRVPASQPWGVHRESWSWIVLIPGALLLLLSGVRRTLKTLGLVSLALLSLGAAGLPETEPESYTKSLKYFREKAYDESLELQTQLLASYPENPALLYNMAVISKAADQGYSTLSYLRRSLGSGVRLPEAVAELEAQESALGLKDQWLPSPLVEPSLLWIVFIVSLTGTLTTAAVVLWKGKRASWYFAALFLAASLGSGLFFRAAESYATEPAGVVAKSPAPLRRVPGEKSEEWMNLPGGTAVRIQGMNRGYALVVTGYGLEGWMSEKDILRTDRSYFSR